MSTSVEGSREDIDTCTRTVSHYAHPSTALTGEMPGVFTPLTANHSRVSVSLVPRIIIIILIKSKNSWCGSFKRTSLYVQMLQNKI